MSFIRWFVGRILLALNALTLSRPMDRSSKDQEEIGKQTQSLILYHFEACPFCIRVRRAMHRLNLTIELRDTMRSEEFAAELLDGGGSRTVPCLKIAEANGEITWMYESNDIVAYLESKFGETK